MAINVLSEKKKNITRAILYPLTVTLKRVQCKRMTIKRGRRRRKTRRKKLKIKEKKKHEVTAIHWFLGQRDWSGLLLPSMCIVMVSICPSVSPPPLSLSFFLGLSAAKVTKTGSDLFVLSFLPKSLFTLRLPMPRFPYFGMSMCYLLILCMNDNMSVYSYRELYPIPLVLTKNGCTDSGFLFIFNSVQLHFFLNVSRSEEQYVFNLDEDDNVFCFGVTCTLLIN